MNFTYSGGHYNIAAVEFGVINLIASAYILVSEISALVEDSKMLQPIQIDALNEQTLCSDLARLYSDGEIFDCTIAVPKNRSRVQSKFIHQKNIILQLIACCRLQNCYLSARSPVFRQMFAADMQEAKSKRVSIEDFDADVVEQFIRYVHTDSIDEPLKVSARELLMIADKYDVRGLRNLAQKELVKSISVKTVCATFEFAMLIADAEALQIACSEFICDNREDVKSKGGWQKLSESAQAKLLQIVF